MRPAAAAGAPTLSPRLTYGLIVYGLTILVATGSFPVGLYPAYQEAFHFSTAMISVLAAISMIGVLAAVVLCGRVSDLVGRRPVMLPAVALGAISLVLFIVAQDVYVLIAARIVGGFGIGLFTGAGTAALTEMTEKAGGDTRRAATHAATTSIVGFASGPIVGGLFVQYGPWPLRLVYFASLLLLIPALAGVLLMEETMTNRQPFRLEPRALRIPPSGRTAFGLATLIALGAFMTTSFFQSLGPTVVIKLLNVSNRAVAAAVVLCFLGTSSLAQMRFRGLPIRRASVTGLVLLPIGIAFLVSGLLVENLALFIAGSLIGGLGQGLAYLGGQSLVELAAPPEQRGELFSVYLVVVYFSGGLTAICLGLAANHFGLHSSAVTYGSIAGVLTLGTAFVMSRAATARPAREPEPEPQLLGYE